MILNLFFWFALLGAEETTVTVTGIESATGTIQIAFYDNADEYLDEVKVACSAIATVTEDGSISFTMNDCPQGIFAAALYHDVNGNGKMDKNILGIPKEPYGFSNNVMGTFGAPSFDKAKFDTRKVDKIEIALR